MTAFEDNGPSHKATQITNHKKLGSKMLKDVKGSYIFVPFWWMLLQFASCMVAIPRKSQLLELGEGDPQRSNAQLRRKFKDEAPAGRLGMVGLGWFAYFLRYLQEACQSHPAAFFWSSSLSLPSLSSNIHSSSSMFYVLSVF